jgi:hypothetical protein
VLTIRHLPCADSADPNLLWRAEFDASGRLVLEGRARPGRRSIEYARADGSLKKLEVLAAMNGDDRMAAKIKGLCAAVAVDVPGAYMRARQLMDAAAAGELERTIPGSTSAVVPGQDRSRPVVGRPGHVPPTQCPSCGAKPRRSYRWLAAHIHDAAGRGTDVIYIDD